MDPVSPPDPSLEAIERSWERSAGHGLSAGLPVIEAVASPGELSERLESNERLIAYAQPVIEHLYQQIARSSSMVLLADNGGMILRAVGDGDFVSRAARISLVPGAIWSESCVGTNAIGTALHEQQPVAVFGQQHYLERNRFLTCVATPILAPSGGILGILDISSDASVTQSHAQALLQTTVEMIENRLIAAIATGSLVLHFHPAVEMLDTPLEGLAVFSEEGLLLSCNRRATALLGLKAGQPGDYRYRFEQLFTMTWASMCEHAARPVAQTIKLRTSGGRVLSVATNLRASKSRSTTFSSGAKSASLSRAVSNSPVLARTLKALDSGVSRHH